MKKMIIAPTLLALVGSALAETCQIVFQAGLSR